MDYKPILSKYIYSDYIQTIKIPAQYINQFLEIQKIFILHIIF
jgi:hypothetical protein